MWNVITAIVSTTVGMTVLGGVVIRFALVPYLRSQLIEPITLQLASIISLANDAVTQVHVISRAWDGHLDWSQKEVDRLWDRMLRAERLISRQQTGDKE